MCDWCPTHDPSPKLQRRSRVWAWLVFLALLVDAGVLGWVWRLGPDALVVAALCVGVACVLTELILLQAE